MSFTATDGVGMVTADSGPSAAGESLGGGAFNQRLGPLILFKRSPSSSLGEPELSIHELKFRKQGGLSLPS